MNKKYLAIIVIVVIGGGYYWYNKAYPSIQPVQYKTAMVEKGPLVISVSASGQVEAVNQVDLKPVVAGDAIEVVKVYVKNDQVVKKGDLIALLDSKDAQKSVRNAELNLIGAEAKYKQAKRDFDHDAINKLNLEQQKVSLRQSQNSLTDAKEKLNDYSVRAPFDGIVTGLSVGAGDSVSRSDVLASVITRDVQAKVSINEIDAPLVKVGSKVTIKIGALPGVTITGKVIKIDTIGQIIQNVVSYNAEISFDEQNELLKPGMSVSAAIIIDVAQNVIKVPNSAVKNKGGQNYVEILNGKSPTQISIEIGVTNNIETEIVSGIKIGDKVVTQVINPNAKTTTSGSGLRLPGMSGSGLR